MLLHYDTILVYFHPILMTWSRNLQSMYPTLSQYIVIVAIAGAINVLLGCYVYSIKTSFPGKKVFIWMTAFSTIYTFAFAFELSSASLQEIRFWLNIEYLGMPFIAPCCLVISWYYTGKDWLATRRNLILLFLIPVITLLLVTTNEYHHLFYRSIYLRPNEATPLVDIVIGEWYIVNGSFTFGCLLAGGIILIKQWKHAKHLYRRQIIVMITSLYLPMAAAFLYVIGVTPHGMDPVPVVMSITGILYFWAMLSTNMLKIAPIAREHIFESMRDGVLVLNAEDHIVDFNQAAKQMIPSLHTTAIGQTLQELWSKHTDDAPPEANDADLLGQQEREVRWTNRNGEDKLEELRYSVRSSPIIRNNNKVTGRTIILIDVTERALLQDQLRKMATVDGLTGIYNRSFFLHQSSQLFESEDHKYQPTCLILFDIDHFKQINDRYGHDVGDQALRHIVTICQPLIPSDSLFARYGGEEFIIYLPDCSLQQSLLLAETLRQELAASSFLTKEGQEVTVTASFGIEEAGNIAGRTLEDIIRAADQALYQSKNNGRNRVQLAADLLIEK